MFYYDLLQQYKIMSPSIPLHLVMFISSIILSSSYIIHRRGGGTRGTVGEGGMGTVGMKKSPDFSLKLKQPSPTHTTKITLKSIAKNAQLL